MKSPKLIKAFMPFACNSALHAWCAKAAKVPDSAAVAIANFIARDPGDSEWSNIGLTEPVEEGSYVHDLDGAACMLMFRISERKLPASVRDEKVAARYKELVEKDGRKLNKKEFAQLREDVESELLPQAFIVPKLIPVLVFKNRIMVGASSASQVEKIMIFLIRLCEARNIKWEWCDIQTQSTPGFLLGQIARNAVEYADADDGLTLNAGRSAVFKGDDKRAIRVKDRDLGSEEIQKISTSGTYDTTELSITFNTSDGGEIVAFTMTDKFVFKGIKLSAVSMAGIGDDVDDRHATYWLLAKTFRQILDAVTFALNSGEGDDDESL